MLKVGDTIKKYRLSAPHSKDLWSIETVPVGTIGVIVSIDEHRMNPYNIKYYHNPNTLSNGNDLWIEPYNTNSIMLENILNN